MATGDLRFKMQWNHVGIEYVEIPHEYLWTQQLENFYDSLVIIDEPGVCKTSTKSTNINVGENWAKFKVSLKREKPKSVSLSANNISLVSCLFYDKSFKFSHELRKCKKIYN